MKDFYEINSIKHKPWKRMLCILLSVIIAFGTVVALMAGSSRLQDWLGIQSMLSAYAAEIVDTKGAASVDKDAMLADNHIIDLENRDGSNTVYMFSEPITYVDESGHIKAKDISVIKQTDDELKAEGYDYTNGQNDYRINFSSDIQKGVLVEYENCRYSIAPKTDYISSAGKKSKSVFLNEEFETFEYNGAFGAQTNLKFYPQLNGVKDEVVLNHNINKNTFSFLLKTENCTAVLDDDGTISLLSNDNKSIIQTFSKPFAYDNEYIEGDKNEHYTDCTYSLEEADENTYILSVNVDFEWLNNPDTAYPVIIDPTTSNIYNFKDTGVYSGKPTNNYGNEQTCCFGKDSGFGYGRAYNQFALPSSITKGTIINSAYIWERETTGRTETTYVTPLVVTADWSETAMTWNNRAGFDRTAGLSRRLINSQCTDDPTNPYWYRFDIKNAVQQWADGKANYGLVFISNEESNNVNNWRAFTSKTYSSSAMRPYTVINYTNDTVAPTIGSVTGNSASWTNSNITLTINGAVDNSGGSGLHSTPYSFSTTKGTYSWQTGNTKTFSSNCTVYIYVRDAAGNIRLASTQTISKIDKTAPSAPTVTGNAEDWTNKAVTLSANSTDAQSGIAAYSFSTIKGTYSWQTSKTKTFDENTILYVYSKDNAGNISQPTVVEVSKIDKTAPETPVVTGHTEDWTNNDIVLTAQSVDDLSGVSEYSFSKEPDQYNWQSENTFEVNQQSMLYIYARDSAGNISNACEVDLKIDKSAPDGSISAEIPTEWVKTVTITADAADEISGLHEKPYSFSSDEGIYSWQAGNEKVITSNGTYYVYARDYVGNITLLDTVTIDKIDNTVPDIYDVDIQNKDDKTVITIIAQDTFSGISQYSIDAGVTWQDSNVFEIEKDSQTSIKINVSDRVNNIASKEYNFKSPKLYFEGNRVGIYKADPDTDRSIYYTFTNRWTKYDKPLYLADCNKWIYVSYISSPAFRKNPETIYYKEPNRFAYSESNVDLSLSFDSVTFDIARKYADNKWFYSYDSSLSTNYNYTLINIQFVDFNSYYFVRQSKYLYLNEVNGYELSVVYDENDENIIEYIFKYNNIDYHYSADGKLASLSNSYGDAFTFEYGSDSIIIRDAAGREVVIGKDDNKTTITDLNGGIITYQFESDKLVKVTDQTGVTIGLYEYTDNKLTKSLDKSIFFDSDDRVTQYLYDNGYSIKFEYGENSVTTITSDEKTTTVTYDVYGNIISSTDNYGDVTTYTYDEEKRFIKAEKGEEVILEYGYNENGDLIYKAENGVHFSCVYDDRNRIVRTDEVNTTEKANREYIYTYYEYDENDNVVLSAVYKSKTSGRIPNGYNPDFATFESVVKYSYENDKLIKAENVDNNTITLYEYDSYDHIIKTTVTSTDEDGNTIITTTSNLYDEYCRLVKITSTKEENGEISIASTENTYDNTGRLLSVKSGDSESTYVYDAAGRTLLTSSDDGCCRTVYDNKGRLVQEIYNDDYNPALDNLPDAYADKTAGHTYTYSDTNNLISETNEYGITTNYEYSDVGTLYKKSFDIYDYYYQNSGRYDRIDVSGETVVDYEYSPVKNDPDGICALITYADGTVEKHLADKYNNIYSKSLNDELYYSSVSLLYKNSIKNYELDVATQITKEDNVLSYKKTEYPLINQFIFDYTVTTEDDLTTIEENYGDKSFKKEITENNIAYTSAAGTINYSYDYENETPTDAVTIDGETVLSSKYTYDSESNTATKTLYYEAGGEIVDLIVNNQYDDNGNISSASYNADYTYTYYSYDDNNQITRADNCYCDYTNVYTYDERGNITSKNEYSYTYGDITTSPRATTIFSYDNEQWLDQLTAVNDTPLTYDANGNLASYGDTEYTWSHGKWLSSVKDGDNTYSYQYDENGIRASKYVNGVKTEFNTLNGVLLSQSSGSDFIYFQYDTNGTPIGFVYNDTQYLYMTNQLGDVISITDAQGREVVEYEYDEWGNPIETTLMMDGETASKIAEINPFRYRGYYYDNETGMYYLQSRYYNPEWGRFISADSFNNLDTSKKYFNMNAYIYCWNCPITFKDDKGTSPTISIDLEAFVSFMKDTNDKITTRFLDNYDKLQKRFDSAVERATYYYYNPGALLSKILSAITGTNINIEFKTLKWIRENRDIDAQSDDEGIETFSSKSKKKDPVITPQGTAVAEIFSTIMLAWDALERGGKDFAAIITRCITLDKSQLYSEKFGEWYESMFNSFIEFTETAFYEILAFADALFGLNFFIEFFDYSTKYKTNYYNIEIGEIITIFFGVGNSDSAFSNFVGLATEGKVPLSSGGGLSVGTIVKPGYWGYYTSSVVSLPEGIYGGINIDFEFKMPDLPNPPSTGGAPALVPNFSYSLDEEAANALVRGAAVGVAVYVLLEVFKYLVATGVLA